MVTAAFPCEFLDSARRLAGTSGLISAVPEADDEDILRGALRNVGFLVVELGRPGIVSCLPSLRSLQVVQVLVSGTDWISASVPRDVQLCNARGTRDIAVAEWVVAAVTGAASGLLPAVRSQSERSWQRNASGEICGQRALVIGMGSIGERVRVQLQALGAEVTGVARHERQGVESVTRIGALLPRADIVILLTPLTAETRGMVDESFLSCLQEDALLVNAGRGAVVDTAALTREVGAGRIRCVLDVVEPEPLPPEHPLWTLPGSYVSPHIAGATRQSRLRANRFAVDQFLRYAGGMPLMNVVDRGHALGGAAPGREPFPSRRQQRKGSMAP